MWLLSTNRAELHYFANLGEIIGGYAILSHTWDPNGEQTFQETMALAKRCQSISANPRDHPDCSPKIRGACLIAERDGYRWIWIDSSCIDKRSSTELSEAINSMFLWYSNAEVCYAYLVDVPADEDPCAEHSAFARSRWHTRGWTLQELLAPSIVLFLSSDWKPIGSKQSLAETIESITGIHRKYLLLELSISGSSLQTRMKWASHRQTTRVEDEAYCLMGLFQVTMPTIYGEGRRAFYRLQHEIIRQSSDCTLLCWGRVNSWSRFCASIPIAIQRMGSALQRHPASSKFFILAPSAAAFTETPYCNYIPRTHDPIQRYPPVTSSDVGSSRAVDECLNRTQMVDDPFGSSELPRFSVAGPNLKCRLPIFDIPGHHGICIAILLCQARDEHVGLLLHLATDTTQDPTRLEYYTVCIARVAVGKTIWYRLVTLGKDLYNIHYNDVKVTPEWRTVYIRDFPRQKTGPGSLNLLPIDRVFSSDQTHCEFRIPRWVLNYLDGLRMELAFIQDVIPTAEEGSNSTGHVIAIGFRYREANSMTILILGTCGPGNTEQNLVQEGSATRHWAKALHARFYYYHLATTNIQHDCSQHHIEDWENMTREFGDTEFRIRLKFTPWRHAPDTTLELQLGVFGEGYESRFLEDDIDVPTAFPNGLLPSVVTRPSSSAEDSAEDSAGRTAVSLSVSPTIAQGSAQTPPIRAAPERVTAAPTAPLSRTARSLRNPRLISPKKISSGEPIRSQLLCPTDVGASKSLALTERAARSSVVTPTRTTAMRLNARSAIPRPRADRNSRLLVRKMRGFTARVMSPPLKHLTKPSLRLRPRLTGPGGSSKKATGSAFGLGDSRQ